MRAAMCRELGTPDVVAVEEVDEPHPGPGEVRVAVAAAAVNFPDVLLIAGKYQVPVPPPFVPGSEFAGTIDGVGDGVDSMSVGDRVFGGTMVGAFAEQVVMPAGMVRRLPDPVDVRIGAAFGVAHQTSYHVLRSVAHVGAGDELVVLGAGGGVGLAAVELGVLLGARVTAVASSDEKLEVAASYGASTLVNHRRDDLRSGLRAALPDGADAVVDPVGGALAEPALRSLRWGGRFVTVGYASGEVPRIPLNLVLLKGVSIVGFDFRTFGAHRPDDLARNEAELVDHLAAGRIRPHIGAAFPFERVAEALKYVGEGRAIGKVLLELG